MTTLLTLPVLTSLSLTLAQSPCEGWTTPEFWEAVDPATVRECLSYGYSVDDRSPFKNTTPLHLAAAFSDDPEVISVLIEAGAILEAYSAPHEARTPLHYAARSSGNPEVLRRLLQYGADVYAKNPVGRTPLHLAALYNDHPAIVAELARVTHVNVRMRTGETPLHDATRKSGFAAVPDPNLAVVEVLLRHGADLAAEAYGTPPIRWSNDRRVVEMIREEEARREAIREQFLRDVTTRVAVGALVLGLLGYLGRRIRTRRRLL
ncbi:ankyrin repeat domain-containing protein [Candidatus Palauibacter sp.]|uniref:ankyrin repeat domain-containing protein n=1 Tax=Candidatus Palauibacter sp. TaxID=3101350 RepID=UPI003B5B7757